MKLILKILGGLLALIMLGIAGIIAWPFIPVVQDRFGGAEHRAWLEDHRTEIDLGAADAGFDFGPEVHGARFVVLAELHGYRAVQALDLALLEHFTENGPARTYLAELSPGQAFAFNQMVSGGDAAPARAVFDAWAQTQAQWANQEFFQKLERIRDLNASLPENRRIWFVGVDAPVDREGLAELVAANAETGVEPGFDSYAAVQALNVELGRDALQRESSNRYVHILANMETAAGLDPQRAFYGLWGLFHGSKTTINGSDPLALRLNREGGVFEDSLASLTTLCVEGCLNMMPARAMPEVLHGDGDPDYIYIPNNFDNVMLARVRGVNEIKAAAGEADIAAFRINGEDSPYADGVRLSALSGYLMLVQGWEYGGPAARVTDYYIVMRNSAGLTPWSGTVHDVTGAAPETGIDAVAARLAE
ncbi:MAG: hypothetical protein RKE49_14280 [Oceanicaulis sp.]